MVFKKIKNSEKLDKDAKHEVARKEAEIKKPHPDNLKDLTAETKKLGKEFGALEEKFKVSDIDSGVADRKEMLKRIVPAGHEVTEMYAHVQRAKLANKIEIQHENDPDFTDKYPLEINA